MANNIVPFTFDEIKNELADIAKENFGISNADYEGSNIQQIIDVIAYEISKQNLGYYLNFKELFLETATLKENIIKEALNLGYIPKRKISSEYKIKLQAKKLLSLILDKNQKFLTKSGIPFLSKNSTLENFGYDVNLKTLYFKNGSEILNSLNVGDKLFFSNGDELNINSFLTQDKKNINLGSNAVKNINEFEEEKQDIFIWTGNYLPNNTREFQQIGTIDGFIIEDDKLLLQFSSDFDIFSFYTEAEETKTLISNGENLVFDSDLNNPIKYIKSIKVNNSDEYVAITDLIFNEGDTNVKIPLTESTILEKHIITGEEGFSGTVTLNKEIDLDNPNLNVKVNIDNINFNVEPENIEIIDSKNIRIQPIIFSYKDTNLPIDSNNNFTVSKENISNVDVILIKDSSGNETEIKDFDIIQPSTIHINENIDSNSNVAVIFYKYFNNLDGKTAEVSFNHKGNIFENTEVTVTYFYDSGNDDILDKQFFFTDLRGEIPENEFSDGEYGWSGFKAIKFDKDPYILTFDLTSDGSLYAPYPDSQGNIIQKRLDEVLNIFKRRKLFYPDSEGNFNKNNYFAKLNSLEIKNSTEIIVKQGELINSEINPNLKFQLNSEMINAGYFLLFNDNIENGSIKIKIKYFENNNIIEKTLNERQTFLIEKEHLNDSFVCVPDINYPEYLRVYFDFEKTKPFGDVVFVDISYIKSLGAAGNTNELIEIQNENFETVPISDSENNILIIQGEDEEDLEKIKVNAPKISNTFGRVVTKRDYKTVIDSYNSFYDASVWGGEEELPNQRLGNVFISTVSQKFNSTLKETKNNVFEMGRSVIDFLNKYLEITGKQYFDKITEIDDSLFQKLGSLKIIDIKLNYKKPTFVNLDLSIKLSKNIEGLNLIQTKEVISKDLKNFSISSFEKFEGNFFKSDFIRILTNLTGKSNETELNYNLKIPLKDNLQNYDLSLFDNVTKQDLIPNDDGIVGYNDLYSKEMFFKISNIFDIFVEDSNGNTIFNFDILPDIETDNFLISGDKIYIDKTPENAIYFIDEESFSGINKNALLFQLKIMYNDGNTLKQVGNYYIDIDNEIVKIEIFTKMNPTDTDVALDRNKFLNFFKFLNLKIQSNELLLNKNSFGILNSITFEE